MIFHVSYGIPPAGWVGESHPSASGSDGASSTKRGRLPPDTCHEIDWPASTKQPGRRRNTGNPSAAGTRRSLSRSLFAGAPGLQANIFTAVAVRTRETKRQKGGWWSRRGSNPRPHECHSCALPSELRPHTGVPWVAHNVRQSQGGARVTQTATRCRRTRPVTVRQVFSTSRSSSFRGLSRGSACPRARGSRVRECPPPPQ